MKPVPRTRSFWLGLTLPWQAARLIVHEPVLLFWSALPTLLTLVLYYYVIGSAVALMQGLLAASFIRLGVDPSGLVFGALELVSGLVLLLVAALTFAFTASVLASPFNDRLSRKAEDYADPPLAPVDDAAPAQQMRLIGIDLAKALAAGVASTFALLVALIPFVNLLSFAAAFVLVSSQYLSYPQTRRGIGLGAGAAFLWRHTWACAGFGATISTLFALPVISSLALPVAVVGGTLLAARCPGGPGHGRLR